jgi:hypothetical protein
MNLPSNYLAAIGSGRNTDQTAEDGRIMIPPMILPSFDIPRPAICDDGDFTGGTCTDSLQFAVYLDRTNQIAATIDAFYLLQGVWELEFSIVVGWNFAIGQNVNAGYLYALDQAGAAATVVAYFGTGAANTVYSQFTRKWHIKPRPDLNVVQGDVWTFIVSQPATNAVGTNNWTMWMNVNARRFL